MTYDLDLSPGSSPDLPRMTKGPLTVREKSVGCGESSRGDENQREVKVQVKGNF
jgi:hypothetical protein